MKYVSNLSDKLVTLEKTGNKLQEERNGIVTVFCATVKFMLNKYTMIYVHMKYHFYID